VVIMRGMHGTVFLIASLLVAAVPAAARAGHCHHSCRCQRCVPCCQQPAPEHREAVEERPRAATRAAVPAPIVQSMPVYTMPMMYAAMPVVPAMATAPATRAAEYRAPGDCCDRVEKLEEQMKELARSMTELQTIVHGQTEVLKVLAAQRPQPREAIPLAPPPVPTK
jgi:hypothetical protein